MDPYATAVWDFDGLWHCAARHGHELEIHPCSHFHLNVWRAVGGIAGIYLSCRWSLHAVIYRRFAPPPVDTTLSGSFVRSPDPKGEESLVA